MKHVAEVGQLLSNGHLTECLCMLYGCQPERADVYAKRYLQLMEGLFTTFGSHENVALFSAPGRTEIGGNHTDHQHGCVLAAAVNIDIIAAVATNGQNVIRLKSEGYDAIAVDLNDLAKRDIEENTSTAILRGTCKAYADRGAVLAGLDIYVSSNVPKGSGLSSSAAFEVLIGAILNDLFMPMPMDAVEIAKIGQWVENVYFGKPCGLMDQMASSVGCAVAIDFQDPAVPIVQKVELDLNDAGLALCIIDSGADHADLTDEYAAVPSDCKRVAAICGKQVLREVDYDVFLKNLTHCRQQLGDRATLRAMHFFADNQRVGKQTQAILKKDYSTFLKLVEQSGHSSFEYLQNVIPTGATLQQSVAVAIAVAKDALGDHGAVRVHGGGFAGTVQAFVPMEMSDSFKKHVESVLGQHSCNMMLIRPVGGYRLV